MKLNFTGIIPARYESTRFPGKPLALIHGVPMVLRVWEQAKSALDKVYIATDHRKIYDVALNAGADVILTSSKHETGTERIAEAASVLFKDKDQSDQVIINIQGDEPLITAKVILDLCTAFKDDEVAIATLIHKFLNPDEIANPNRPKVAIGNNKNALSFSRAPISSSQLNYQHVGVYAYKLKTLFEIVKLKPTSLEQSERLEQIRWLDNAYSIRCVETEYEGIGVDCPEDLDKVSQILARIRKD